MKEIGIVTINVLKDEANNYLFDIQHDNDNLYNVCEVVEDALKYY